MKINIKLDTRSTKMAIKNLKRYHDDLVKKCRIYVEKLADAGIKVAKVNEGEYSGAIVYQKLMRDEKAGCTCILTMTGKQLERTWRVGRDGEATAYVDALLMAEFGSGWNAEVLLDVTGVGQGTFPNQTHAFDPEGWMWRDLEGNLHVSTGEVPTHPVHNAWLEMQSQMSKIAKEVFGSGR